MSKNPRSNDRFKPGGAIGPKPEFCFETFFATLNARVKLSDKKLLVEANLPNLKTSIDYIKKVITVFEQDKSGYLQQLQSVYKQIPVAN